MSDFLTGIHINKIFHLENISIEIDNQKKKHLIITGRNGCGKTSLLNALVDFLEKIKTDKILSFIKLDDNISSARQTITYLRNNNDLAGILSQEQHISYLEKMKESVFGNITPAFSDIIETSKKFHSGNYIFAFYQAKRFTKVDVPENPIKPNLNPVASIKDSKQNEFLKFLVDLKVQEALARNENAIEEADKIREWFESFTALLQRLFDGASVSLDFNFRDYSFTIKQGNKAFGFNELSDGYSAIVDIIADLILKMQSPDSLTRAYEKEGIVLIDEIETHLHLELQKEILPMLTTVFPNIQFVVTTHSPFVLNSLEDVVVFDLEKQKRVENLTGYSYESLAEGYFEVQTDSSYLQNRLNRFKALAEKPDRDSAEKAEFEALDKEFDSLDDIVAPRIKGEYLQIKLGLL